MLKRLAPFASANSNKSTPNPTKPNTIISISAYHDSSLAKIQGRGIHLYGHSFQIET